MGQKNTIFPGHRFGKLTVTYELLERVGGKRAYLCQCECGEAAVRTSANLLSGGYLSCGCYKGEASSVRNRTHGYSQNREARIYRIWINMRVRCSKPNAPDYARYGGRGIKVCERWQRFENFLADMGLPPSRRHTLDRTDVNGNYCPENCKWSTHKEQQRNRRSNHTVTYQGATFTLVEWSERTGIPTDTLSKRLNNYGWSTEKALTTPVDYSKHPQYRRER